jgi:threonine-phosphate decarboxylase
LAVSALKLKRALIPIPTFGEYERAVKLSGGNSIFVDIFDMAPRMRLDRIKRCLSRADSLFICNPNNPDGFLFKREELQGLAEECAKKGVFLIVDEAFMDFVEEPDRVSMIKYAIRKKNILVLRSLTKFFALPGLRIGYLAAHRNLIKKISFSRQPWSVNSLAQIAGAHAITDKSFIQESRKFMFKEREKLFDALNKIAYLAPYPPSANFIFCEIVKGRINSRKLSDHCGKKGLLLRDCSDFPGLDGRFIRIAVRKADENKKLIKVLREIS